MRISPSRVVQWLRRKTGPRPSTARDALERLDGALLQRRTRDFWQGSFEGAVTIENVREGDDAQMHFDLLVPTSAADFDDFIHRREREDGATEKVLLTRAGSSVPDAHIVRISREGKRAEWNFADAEQYRLTYVAERDSLESAEPLEVHIRWFDERTHQWNEIAVASAAPKKRS